MRTTLYLTKKLKLKQTWHKEKHNEEPQEDEVSLIISISEKVLIGKDQKFVWKTKQPILIEGKTPATHSAWPFSSS